MANELDPGRLEVFLEFVSACARIREQSKLLRLLTERAHLLLDFKRLSILLCDDKLQIVRIILIEKNQISREASADQIEPVEMDQLLQALMTGTVSSGSAGMCTPMESVGRMVGALYFAGTEQYTDQELRLVHFLADCLAGTFERLARANAAVSPTDAVLSADVLSADVLSADDVREVSLAVAHATSLRMSYLAQHDALTNLPNRLLLNDRLARALALSSRYHRRLAVLFLDLDGFKEINDSLGHAIGDQVLRQISDRLVKCVRSSDTVSRIGGDEFVVLLAELQRPEDAAVSAGKIIAAITAPMQISDHQVHTTVSIGVSVYPGDGEDAATLIKSADTAMYHAKAEGRGKCQFFSEDMNAITLERQFLEKGLRAALEREEFVLHYQPKVNLETGAVVGAEALLRWLHPDRGLLFPAEFLTIAEQSGLIAPIGEWVLRETSKQAQAWVDSGLPAITVSVNISAAELLRKSFLENVGRVLEESHLQPRYLELEMTEDVLMTLTESHNSILQKLKAMGMRLTVDNFGMGHSSLSALTHLPIDALKVDPSFVHQLTPESNGAFGKGAGRIISTLIGLGKNLGYRVVAVGVETSEQLAFLQAQHCREGQGNYFSPPLPASQFANVLEKGYVHAVN